MKYIIPLLGFIVACAPAPKIPVTDMVDVSEVPVNSAILDIDPSSTVWGSRHKAEYKDQVTWIVSIDPGNGQAKSWYYETDIPTTINFLLYNQNDWKCWTQYHIYGANSEDLIVGCGNIKTGANVSMDRFAACGPMQRDTFEVTEYGFHLVVECEFLGDKK